MVLSRRLAAFYFRLNSIMLRYISVLLCLTTLYGCSGPAGTYKVYWDSLGAAFASSNDVEITREDAANAPYSLLLVKPGESATALMVLAYLEHGQHKWISSDDAVLVTESGRIVKTLGFDNDLLVVSGAEHDPLKLGIAGLETASWRRQVDFSTNREHGFVVTSDFSYGGTQTLILLEQNYTTDLFIEAVTFADKQHRFTNKFWFDKASGKLLKTEQQLSPYWPVFSLTFLSNAL